ncbi:hypothetical protein HU200_039146 [Digitaria exilis]|uniref:Uncharacterized protein n=1 Tax=Digitaria exilis TaxID=1010633 RepID=A0A835BDF5_9POAL|nr:hypothetical protein HU200_039146 [Digitaria exilis]
MEKRAAVVITVASLLGLVAASLGFAAEYFKHRAFVGSDTYRCEYRRTPALGFGIVAALLSLSAVTLVTGASSCFGRCGAIATESGRGCVWKVLASIAWFMVASATVMFLYGAAWNAGGTRGFTTVSRPIGDNGRGFAFVCPELRDGVFVAASIKAGIAVACAITAYADILKRRGRTPTLGVEMEQAAYPAAPVAYPHAPPPPYGGGYGAKY